jgi:3-oxoacyl-(acyl-carrier-protein) synthase
VPPDAPARRLAGRFKAGHAHATVAACATGVLAVIRGAQFILDGQADVVIAGSSDASLQPLWFAAFRQMGVLADGHPDRGPSWACRPFDQSRDGFVVSEGAAVLVLESAESVHRRGVQPLARIAGYAMGSDPAGLAQLRPDGAPLAEIIKIACRQAGMDPADLALIQAHGTGTRTNDLVEINAVRRACGARTPEIPVVSIKGALGHLLGAAGSVELAIAVLSAARRMIPPNATLIDPDPALGPVCLPKEAVSMPPGPVLKLAIGFGGHLAAVVLDQA